MDSATQQLLDAAGYDPSDEDIAFFEELRGRLVAANEQLNLTRLTEPADFWIKHVLDSMLPFLVVEGLRGLDEKAMVADFGAGGGFPGFVLARHFPHWDLALIERRQKKCDYLEATAEALGLENVYVVPLDAREAIHQVPALDRGCDLVVARAVGRLGKVTRAAEPLLRPHGLILHYKGGSLAQDEINEGKKAAREMVAKQHEPVYYDLPPDARRAAVLVESRPHARKRKEALRRRQSSQRSKT
ncbi:MAG: 16S rRNA (guanine(527)-N(7))-methyltransferase RsmG [Planctomycetota bacterium]